MQEPSTEVAHPGAAANPNPSKIVSKPKTGTDTVFVGLKLSMGLRLDHFELQKEPISTPQGILLQDVMRRTGEPFFLRGNANIIEMQQRGELPDTGGYAITAGVPRDLVEEWF